MATWNINIGGAKLTGRADNYREFSGKEDWPFAVGEMRGVRSWRVCSEGCLHPLHVHHTPAWTAGVNRAVCGRKPSDSSLPSVGDHGAPDDGCSCGFYAFFDRGDTIEDLQLILASAVPLTVAGTIRGYGRTLIGTKGFRCEKAEIESLYVDPDSRLNRILEGMYPGIPRVRRPKYEHGPFTVGPWASMFFSSHNTKKEGT